MPRAMPSGDQEPARLYLSTARGRRWVGQDAAGAWQSWPCEPDGWEERRPFAFAAAGLAEVDPSSARGTGWPGAGTGRKRLGEGEVTVAKQLKAPASWWIAIETEAAKRHKNASKTIRELVEEALAGEAK